MARLDKLLCRTDILYQVLSQQRCAFTILPSAALFEPYLDWAKETRGMFKEGTWDTRDGESRVWRDIESHDVDPYKVWLFGHNACC